MCKTSPEGIAHFNFSKQVKFKGYNKQPVFEKYENIIKHIKKNTNKKNLLKNKYLKVK